MSIGWVKRRRLLTQGAVVGVLAVGLFTIGDAARADVTAVQGSAYGYHLNVVILATPYEDGPEPTVALPATGGVLSTTVASGSAVGGPATFFTSGEITVSSQGTLGPAGAVASSAELNDLTNFNGELLAASEVRSQCTASEANGASGTTTFTNAVLQTDSGDSDNMNQISDHAATTVNVDPNPAPNTVVNGHFHVGNTTDNYSVTLNEQIVNPDGSLTVNAFHVTYLGPTVTGSLIVGQSVCGVTASGSPTPTLTTQATPSATLGEPIEDIATLSGGVNPTGTLTFSVFPPTDPTCSGVASDTSVKAVSGNDNYTSDAYTPTATGDYKWVVVYSGDANNNPVTSACGAPNETSTITAAPSSPDCAVTQLVFQSTWVHQIQQQVKVVGKNAGTVQAVCRVTLSARRIAPTSGPPAPRYPGAYRVSAAPGASFVRYFEVTPPVAGTYRVTACARAIDNSGTVIDGVASNNCRTANRTAK